MAEGKEGRSIGFIGLGLMGSAMAEMLMADGHDLTVWNRETEVLAGFAERGARIAATPAEVTVHSDIVMLCVLDTHAVEAVTFGARGVVEAGSPEKLLIDHSTTMPIPTESMAKELKKRCGMAWVDAPVSGGPAFARERRLTIMAGGEDAAFNVARPLFTSYAANVTRMGLTGAGQMTKVINQAISGVSYVLMAEVLRLAEEGGIDAERIPECLAGGHADSTMLHYAYPKMLERAFLPPASRASQMLKDLQNVTSEARRLGLDLLLVEAARQRFSTYVEKGNGERETASIYQSYLDDLVADKDVR
ncbi:NAD(P)-dependent oxidoreductase [Rhizobium sp. BK251]|uniref:NAD(P)-dependent oxidoreductase n=1 Tax=Rhizobium sp. BK251 TaxID=2512125 RepID=UPI0010485F10|nr:NAD(P)-dependent oxidoreductase [Rhizobium sp. BK251]TCL66439.1 3-hydroxyisobutyrate dehydrogenase [Rhizobium sp. BK251]